MKTQEISRLVERELEKQSRPKRDLPSPKETEQQIQTRLEAVQEEKKTVFKKIDEMRDEAISLFQSLIRRESVNPSPNFDSRARKKAAGM